MSASLQPHGLYSTRHPCPWDFPGENTRVGCHFLLQGIFLTQGLNPRLLHGRVTSLPLSHQGSSTIAWGFPRFKEKKTPFQKTRLWVSSDRQWPHPPGSNGTTPSTSQGQGRASLSSKKKIFFWMDMLLLPKWWNNYHSLSILNGSCFKGILCLTSCYPHSIPINSCYLLPVGGWGIWGQGG